VVNLILVRHGNTFRPGEKSVWVGARTDLPLVEKGRQQAHAVAESMAGARVQPDIMLSSPLQRTRETATIIAGLIGYPQEQIRIEHRLREIDYCAWEGKSADEVRVERGEEELLAWEEEGRWPLHAGWSPSEQELVRGVASLVDQLSGDHPEDTVVLVSSNGVFRVLGKQFGLSPGECKMATGRCSLLRVSDRGRDILAWNVAPSESCWTSLSQT
jgi:broad specificity phosphatase PhoE